MTPPGSTEALIARLLSLPFAERATVLADALAADPALRDRQKEITAVLDAAANDAAGPKSNDALAFVLQSALDVAPIETPGTRIGPYKLLQEIGRGGFGVVWMAEQLEPIRRQVAVKIVKLGMDTEEVVTRFEAERQALARMEHPNIARVIDAGATDSGRPYFVMELVRGTAITRYCDENRLSTETRLRLFVSVCQAVEHAHQKGIIHRDLKPSNILVTMNDGVAFPKIIDFGIAKATQGRLTDKTLFTQFHDFLGTPAYASPEQMEMSVLDVDTRTDIYSLGVLLYQLLTGHPPFDPDKLARSGLDAMRRTIREVDPPRPSHRLATLSEEGRTSVAQRCGIGVGKLSLLLRGDLDWIVMHCLEKSRSRRYETVTGLSRDVERYLAHEPVAARPPSAAYQLGKFIRRHRLGFAAGTAVLLSIVAGLVMLSVLFVRERMAREREGVLRAVADTKADQARIAGQKSAQTAEFMKGMLSGVAPSVARGRDTAMLREILDATARKLDTELANQPDVAAELRETLGTVYRDLGQDATAEKLLRAAVEARRKINGNDSAELAAALEVHGKLLKNLGRPGAKDELLEALAIRQKLFGDKHPLVVRSMAQLSHLSPSEFASVAEWEALRRQVLARRIEILGPEHPDIAESYSGLGTAALFRNDFAEAARLYRQALDLNRRLLGPDHPEVIANLVTLGLALNNDGNWPEAAAAFREALQLALKVRPEHPQVTGTLLQLVGGQPPDVRDDTLVALARAAVAAQRTHLGPSAPAVAVSTLALAVLLSGTPETADEAQMLTREAVAILEQNRRDGVAPAFTIYGEMESCAMGRFMGGAPAQAFTLLEQRILFARAGLGPSIPKSLSSLLLMAVVDFHTGRIAEALPLWEETLLLLRKSLPASPQTFAHLSLFGAANRELGRLTEAERVLRDGLATMRKSLGDTGVPDPAVAVVYCELGLTLNAQSRFAEAEPYLRQSLENHDRVGREKAARSRLSVWQRLRPRAEAESGLGEALAGQGNFTAAEPLLRNAFATLQAQRNTLGGDRSKLPREAAGRLAAFYATRGQPDEAAKWVAAQR